MFTAWFGVSFPINILTELYYLADPLADMPPVTFFWSKKFEYSIAYEIKDIQQQILINLT